MGPRPTAAPSLALWLLSACNPLDVNVSHASDQGVAATSDDGSSAGADSSESSESATSEGAAVCEAVDMLFVVDSSSGMATHQQNLIASFPAFWGELSGALDPASSVHLGVITTDYYGINVAGCRDLGSLIVRTGGVNSSSAICGPYAQGQNFMTEDDELENAFACAAQVGTVGDDERPIAAAQAATSLALQDPGECNEGYLRTDSLLVVVLLTDEPDGPGDCEGPDPEFVSSGTPDDWYAELVAARGGVESNIVVLTLTYWPGDDCDGGALEACTTDALKSFTELFSRGRAASLCEDFDSFFAAAALEIADACEQYTPVESL